MKGSPKPTRILPRGANPPRIRVFLYVSAYERLIWYVANPAPAARIFALVWGSLYSIVSLADRWSGPAAGVEPVSWKEPEFPVFVSRFLVTEGWSEMEGFACATGRGRRGRSIRRLKDGARQNIIPSSVSYRSRSLSVPLARSRLRRTRMRQKWWG